MTKNQRTGLALMLWCVFAVQYMFWNWADFNTIERAVTNILVTAGMGCGTTLLIGKEREG